MNGLIVSVVINIFSSIIYDVVGKGINLESKKLKQIKENAKQSVSRELARMQEQSRIFDTDAMQSYLKNMKPIEQIFQYVFQGDSALKMTSDELIYKLCQNTAEYLKERGKTIEFIKRLICQYDVEDSIPLDCILTKMIGNYKYIYATVFGQYLWTNLNGILYL